MDISHWNLNQIMQLPDFCFGQRWVLNVVGKGSFNNPVFSISKIELPEWCILWELVAYGDRGAAVHASMELRLGDKLVTTQAEFQAYDPLLKYVGCMTGNTSRFSIMGNHALAFRNLKTPIHSAGRSLCGFHLSPDANEVRSMAYIVVSSVPTEVPDWLVPAK